MFINIRFLACASAATALGLALPTVSAQTANQAGVKPGDDFWTYVNGAWNEKTEIDADRTSAVFDQFAMREQLGALPEGPAA